MLKKINRLLAFLAVTLVIPVILLVSGAAFFTIYFSFVNIRRFRLAIQVVRGKHDDLEKDATDVKPGNVNVVSGDIVDTIKDESHHGEGGFVMMLPLVLYCRVGYGWFGKYCRCSYSHCNWRTGCHFLDDSLRLTWYEQQVCGMYPWSKIP